MLPGGDVTAPVGWEHGDGFVALNVITRLKLLTRLPACPNARGTGHVEKVIKVNWLTP